MIDFDALEKEMAELNEKKKAWDKAFGRAYEIWGILAKHEDEYYKWKRKKQNGKKTKLIGEKGVYPCPKCGANDWTPQLWIDGEPNDKCNVCGYEFTRKDIPSFNKLPNSLLHHSEKPKGETTL